MRLFGIELTDEEYDYLICENTKNKDLQVVESKDEENNTIKTIVAVEKVITPEELAFAKQQQYEELIESKIRQKYTVSQEFAVQRKRYTEPEKFDEYNSYVEKCISDAKMEVLNAVNQEQIEESLSEEREDGDESGQEQTTSVSDCLLSKEEIKMIINDESL